MLELAKKASREAGKILIRHFRKQIEVRLKGANDLVANVDVLAEKKVLKVLKTKYPGHKYNCEEEGLIKSKDSIYEWQIDAMDGTINYIKGIPTFCVSIGLLKNDKPFLGVVYDPLHKEMFYAQKGKGAYLNGKKIRVSRTKDLAMAVLGTDLTQTRKYQKGFFKIMQEISPLILGIRVINCTSLNLAYLACGRDELYIKNKAGLTDVAAGAIIIKEAGGVVTDFNNRSVSKKMKNVVIGNKTLHKKLMQSKLSFLC